MTNIFTERKNSLGFDLSENSNLENLEKSISAHKKNKINAVYDKIKLEESELKDFINKLRKEINL